MDCIPTASIGFNVDAYTSYLPVFKTCPSQWCMHMLSTFICGQAGRDSKASMTIYKAFLSPHNTTSLPRPHLTSSPAPYSHYPADKDA